MEGTPLLEDLALFLVDGTPLRVYETAFLVNGSPLPADGMPL